VLIRQGKKEKAAKKEKNAQTLDYFLLAERLLQPGTLPEKIVALAVPLLQYTPLGAAVRKTSISLVQEIGGGYLRWKALRLGLKLFKILLNTLTAHPEKNKA
jgi:hypothetical protein